MRRKMGPALAAAHETSGATALRRQAPPTKGRALTKGTLPLRFEMGLSLPFGKASFDRAFKDVPRVHNALYEAFVPSTRQGQIGGHAYSTEGHNCRLNVELAQRGMPGHLSPYTYETIADLDRVIPDLPDSLSKKQSYVEKLKADLETLRPRVAWVEEHLHELSVWQPFLCLNGNDAIDLEWGSDGTSLWTFIRAADLADTQFGNLVGEVVS